MVQPSTGFSPASVTGLRLWLRADRGVLDASDAPITSDATAVKTWQDYSGNNFHFTQATSGDRPIWKDNILNGHPVIRFASADFLRYAGTFDSSTSGTIIIVFKGVASGDKTIFASADEATAFDSYFVLRPTHVGSNRIDILQHSAGDTPDEVRGSDTLTSGNYYIGQWQSTGTAYKLWVNGAAQSLSVLGGSNTGDWLGDTANRDSVTLASLTANSTIQTYDGDIAEVLYYDNEISGGDQDNIETYLGTRYSITVV